jgi:hypothetical protein
MGGIMYNYQTELEACQKAELADGVIKTLKTIERLDNVFTLEQVLMQNRMGGSSWRQMMYVDMLCELGYIRKLHGTYEATQYQQYIKQ